MKSLEAAIPPVLFCLIAGVFMFWLAPRPYYILENDYENGHYYNFKLMNAGYPIHNIEHPGTPVMLAGALLMRWTSAGIGDTGRFLVVARCISLFLSCAALTGFQIFLRRFVPVQVSLLVLVLIATWPPVLTFWDYFCSESFIPVTGLPLMAAFLYCLYQQPRVSVSGLTLLGLLTGVCISVKLTFLPACFVLIAVIAIRVFMEKTSLFGRVLKALFLVLMALVSFMFMILPVFHRLVEIIAKTVARPETRSSVSVFTQNASSVLKDLAVQSPGFLVAAAVVIIAVIFRLVQSRGFPGERKDTEHPLTRPAGAAAIFLSMVVIAFVLSNDGSYRQSVYVTGNSLRNLTPLLLLLCLMAVQEGPGLSRFLARLVSERRQTGWMYGFTVAAILTSTGLQFHARSKMIREESDRIARMGAEMESISREHGLIAFWDGSPGRLMGPPSFHFWGNYRYAHDQFDREVTLAFPGLSFVKLREIARQIHRGKEERIGVDPDGGKAQSPSIPAALYRQTGLKSAWWRVQSRHPNPYGPRNRDIVSGESAGVTAGVLMWPVRQQQLEMPAIPREELLAFLQGRYGAVDFQEKELAGETWIAVFLSGSSG